MEPLLNDFEPDTTSTHPVEVQQAVYLARRLQRRASQLQTPQERKQQVELDRMIRSPHDKATLTQLTDQAFRSNVPHRVADQLIHILDVQGVPRFFSPLDRTLLKGFQSFGSYLPGVAVPLVKGKMHHETANVILPAQRDLLRRHLEERRDAGLRMNVNLLGEMMLGEKEAERRLQAYLATLVRPEIEVISVKISTLYSQISPIAREHTIGVLCDRLERLYRAAADSRFERADGSSVPKFVYLDMEEHRDMSITVDAFTRTLDRPGLENVGAGIALQAYLPDSYAAQQHILQWARQRVSAGRAAPTIRIVKGANMEMQRVEASINGWPQAPFKTKVETDANYKRMLCLGIQPDNLAAVHLGVASHNLFDLSYALVLAARAGALDAVQFEMIEGMANHQRRALSELDDNVLLYAPACEKEDFVHAIGYLVRRLDENTGPDNFLAHAFRLEVDGDEWRRLEKGFLDSFALVDTLSEAPRNTQNRNLPSPAPPDDGPWWTLVNEPPTDFALPHNADWAGQIVDQWQDKCDARAIDIPLVVDGRENHEGRSALKSTDPSRPGVVAARYVPAGEEDVDRAVAAAHADADGWRSCSADERREVLRRAAHELRCARAELMGAALAEGGKTLLESDPEVSEAVDFTEFYSRCAVDLAQRSEGRSRGKGVVVVVSPWNFPLAIPCGGVAAALAAGNTVILKPASDTVLCAYLLCRCFWQAGVSQRTLQFLPGPGGTVGERLISHDAVDAVILTGGTETALAMLHRKADLPLLAETGGKNATIVTALSDRDQAIKHVLHSALSHSGQKCSATSLLILEEEVYHDARFKAALCDAVESLHVGSAWKLHNKMGPLIRPPQGKLKAALSQLEPGESWAVMPRQLDHNPSLYSPAVKWDVQPGSVSHTTELFGPVLGVMKARNLNEAIDLVNVTGYGLTSGLESLDDREQRLWLEGIRAGNLYVNRPTTGAIVLRQPFGGMGKSAFGPGVKAGGPNYVALLMDHEETPLTTSGHVSERAIQREHAADDQPEVSLVWDGGSPTATLSHQPPAEEHLAPLAKELALLADSDSSWPADQLSRAIAAIDSYQHFMHEEFGRPHDHFKLIGEDNIRRYLPVPELRVRFATGDSLFELFARVSAARAAGCRTTVSYPPEQHGSASLRLLDELTHDWGGAIELVEESDDRLTDVIQQRQTDRVRYAATDRVSPVARLAAADNQIYLADAPVLADGRIELLWYVREQSLSLSYHRYGNLGMRADEARSPVL